MSGSRRTAVLAALAAAVLAVVTACSSGNAETGNDHGESGHNHATMVPSDLTNQQADSPYLGVGLVPPKPRPSFTLTDTNGTVVDFGTLTAGRPTMLFFGFTHCEDECPTTFADINLALNALPADVRTQTLVVFVTTDPARDDGPAIRTWLDQYTDGLSPDQFIGLCGTQAQIDAAQAAAGVFIAEDGGETHSTSVMLYGPDDYAHVQFLLGDTEQAAMIHDLPLIAAMK